MTIFSVNIVLCVVASPTYWLELMIAHTDIEQNKQNYEQRPQAKAIDDRYNDVVSKSKAKKKRKNQNKKRILFGLSSYLQQNWEKKELLIYGGGDLMKVNTQTMTQPTDEMLCVCFLPCYGTPYNKRHLKR